MRSPVRFIVAWTSEPHADVPVNVCIIDSKAKLVHFWTRARQNVTVGLAVRCVSAAPKAISCDKTPPVVTPDALLPHAPKERLILLVVTWGECFVFV